MLVVSKKAEAFPSSSEDHSADGTNLFIEHNRVVWLP
jgi:hypothetical protein